MQSSSEEKTQAALLLWAALSHTVPAVCTGLPCQETAQIHTATKNHVAAWNSTNSCQITKFLTRLTSVLSLSRKNVHDHRCCPISAVLLTTSKLEPSSTKSFNPLGNTEHSNLLKSFSRLHQRVLNNLQRTSFPRGRMIWLMTPPPPPPHSPAS
jgi:hypothetical protein